MKGRAEQRPTWREDRAKAMEKTALVSQREREQPSYLQPGLELLLPVL